MVVFPFNLLDAFPNFTGARDDHYYYFYLVVLLNKQKKYRREEADDNDDDDDTSSWLYESTLIPKKTKHMILVILRQEGNSLERNFVSQIRKNGGSKIA